MINLDALGFIHMMEVSLRSSHHNYIGQIHEKMWEKKKEMDL